MHVKHQIFILEGLTYTNVKVGLEAELEVPSKALNWTNHRLKNEVVNYFNNKKKEKKLRCHQIK